ncbi:MAG: DNA adenine methylase [Myxococcota bacterium]
MASTLATAPRARSLPEGARAPRPFVKWAGGKGRLLPQLTPMLPPGVHLMRHVEPFVGGGAFFFARRPERALLADVNPALIRSYEAIRDDVEGVIGALDVLAAGHRAGDEEQSKAHFYRQRERYNTDEEGRTAAQHAALFVYLNKTCFNGLHRVNRRGAFNVPFGRYANPTICDAPALRAASRALGQATLKTQPFEALVAAARPGDFVYFDPPYEPVSETASFTSYARQGFQRADQAALRDVFADLDRRGCKLMLSNSDVPFIRDLYARWRIDTVAAARAINCNARRRGKVSEVVVRNY